MIFAPGEKVWHFIKCPECNFQQAATVELTVPFPTYVHNCINCGYTIMESEWNCIRPLAQKLEPGKFIQQVPGDVPLRALSWKPPFGTAMLHGKIETRVWDTKYRGYVLLCNSAAPYTRKQIERICGFIQFERLNVACNGSTGWFGHAIAVGKIVDSRPMKKEDEDKCFVQFNPELFCHVYEDVRAIKPFPWKGSLGWGKVSPEQRKMIELI